MWTTQNTRLKGPCNTTVGNLRVQCNYTSGTPHMYMCRISYCVSTYVPGPPPAGGGGGAPEGGGGARGPGGGGPPGAVYVD